jgi:pilus assembly protein CpaF
MEANTITLQEIYTYKQTGVDQNKKVVGAHAPTGFIPKFVSKLDEKGISLPKGIFSAGAQAAAPIPRGRPA